MLSVKKMPFFSNLPRFALIRDTAKKHYIGNISSILRSRDFKLRRLNLANSLTYHYNSVGLKKCIFVADI